MGGRIGEMVIADTSDAMAGLTRLEVVMPEAIEEGAREVYRFLIDYHSQMDWRGSNWFPGPASGQFAANVVKGWQPPVIAGNTATIENTFGLLSWKVTGGTITPKNAQALAIPLMGTAKGVSPLNYFTPLFRVGSALMRRQIGGQLEAAYALARSVTQAPWPGALPDNADVAQVFMDGVRPVLEAAA